MRRLGRLLLGLLLTGAVEACSLDSTAPSTSAMYSLRRVGSQSLPARVNSARRAPRYIADTLLLLPSQAGGIRFPVYRITVVESPNGERSRATTRLYATRRNNLLRIHSCPDGRVCPPAVSMAAPAPFWFVGDLLIEEVTPNSGAMPRVYSRVR